MIQLPNKELLTKRGEKYKISAYFAKRLKKKKTMNVIMLLFIILAAMFVASGLNKCNHCYERHRLLS